MRWCGSVEILLVVVALLHDHLGDFVSRGIVVRPHEFGADVVYISLSVVMRIYQHRYIQSYLPVLNPKVCR